MASKLKDERVADPMLASLSGEQVLLSNSLGIVTNSWVVVRPVAGRARVLMSLRGVSQVRRIKTTHPAFLVIASGLSLIAAGAYYSKDGGGAAIPTAVLAVLFLFAYLGTRRGSVLFVNGWETTETGLGSLREASELISAIRQSQQTRENEPVTL